MLECYVEYRPATNNICGYEFSDCGLDAYMVVMCLVLAWMAAAYRAIALMVALVVLVDCIAAVCTLYYESLSTGLIS